MKGKNKENGVCVFCNKKIDHKKDNFVVVSTFNRFKKPDHHDPFHFLCWVDFFDDRVRKRAKSMVEHMRSEAMELMNSPMIRTALMEVPNFEQIVRLLNTPLNNKRRVMAQIQNDRAKRSKKTNKVQ